MEKTNKELLYYTIVLIYIFWKNTGVRPIYALATGTCVNWLV